MGFLSKRQFFEDILLNLMKKTEQEYVLSKFTDCIFITIKFDSWMSKGSHDIFVFVINFLGCDWEIFKNCLHNFFIFF